MDRASDPSSTRAHTSWVASDRRMMRLSLLTDIPISWANFSSLFSSSAVGAPFFRRPAFCFMPSIFKRSVRDRS